MAENQIRPVVTAPLSAVASLMLPVPLSPLLVAGINDRLSEYGIGLPVNCSKLSNKYMKKNKLAIASFWLGLASIFLWEFSLLPILAIIFGIIALFQIKKSMGDKIYVTGNSDAWIGTGLGVIFLIVRLFS